MRQTVLDTSCAGCLKPSGRQFSKICLFPFGGVNTNQLNPKQFPSHRLFFSHGDEYVFFPSNCSSHEIHQIHLPSQRYLSFFFSHLRIFLVFQLRLSVWIWFNLDFDPASRAGSPFRRTKRKTMRQIYQYERIMKYEGVIYR